MKIKNFKSFCPKETSIEFRPGLSMVAGPNGSGKSNIGDALLFVLGTRSSKSVRADRLDDLIHNPSNSESRLNTASVKVTFVEDKEEGTFESVELERTLTQSGSDITSTYYINGKRAKHTDVERFLENIGIELDSYSFVLQGDINKFIYVTGLERRKLLESIAGIDSYNARIYAAKEKSQETEKIIMASNTLMEEIQGEIDKVREDAEKLRQHNRLSSEIKNLKYTSLVMQTRNLEIEKSGIENSLSEEDARINNLEVQLQRLKVTQVELQDKRSSIEKNISETIHKELDELRKKMENLKLESARKEIAVGNLNKTIQSSRSEMEENEEKIASIEKEVLELGERVSKLGISDQENRRREAALKEQIRQRIDAQTNKTDLYRKSTDELKRIEGELRELEEKSSSIKKQETEQISISERLQSKLASREETLANEKYRLSEAQWKLRDLQKNLSTHKEMNDSLNKKYFDLQSSISAKEKSRVDVRNRVDALSKEVEKARAEMGSQGNANRSISTLMEAKARGNLKGIHKPISELLSYEDKVAIAVETAAGGRLNSVVVDDENVAQECIEYLREKRMGRVTFIPLNKMVPGRPRGKALLILQSEKSASLLSQTVQYDPLYENAIWYTFSDTILVDDIQVAKRYMTGVRIVTLEGDIFEASGAISGGFTNRTRRVFNSSDLEKKETQLESLKSDLYALDSELTHLRSEYDKISRALMDISKSGGQSQGQENSLQSTITSSQKAIENMSIEAQALRTDLKLSLEVLDGIRQSLKEFDEKKSVLEKEKQKLYSIIGDNGDESDDLNEMQNELDRISVSVNEIVREKSERETTLNKISERKIELINVNENLKKEIDESSIKIETIDEEIAELNRQMNDLKKEEEKINSANTAILKELKGLELEISINGQTIKSIEGEKRALENSTLTSRIKIQNLSEKIEALRVSLSETGGEEIPGYTGLQKINAEISRREHDLQEIGAVNQLAEEELLEKTTRKESLETKINLLQKEVDSLYRLMEELETVKKNVLMDIYRKIRVEMREIFKRLSRGGDVDMYLSDENNPLESELLIKAKPKGDVFTKLQSLSGGEKSLVALSFIVAVQRSKPSPVYFLDEIDMFLDGANAEAMGDLLRENSNTSQVIMISLKNAMGKYANSLFGITMNRKTGCTEVFSKDIGGD